MRVRVGPLVLPRDSPHALGPIGHEFIGVVDQVGDDITALTPGDLVVAPFTFCDGVCANCVAGWPSNCLSGGSFGNHGVDGGQGEAVRVPYADATLVTVPAAGNSEEMLKSLLALSDVMCTGHHAAVSAGVKPGDTVAVVGDGAVGLCAVIAAKRLGAARIISLSRNPARQALAAEFGATDLVAERGDDATADGTINPGGVFDYSTDLDGVVDAYEAMAQRRAIKSLIRISTP